VVVEAARDWQRLWGEGGATWRIGAQGLSLLARFGEAHDQPGHELKAPHAAMLILENRRLALRHDRLGFVVLAREL
jgi:hypothetical protein